MGALVLEEFLERNCPIFGGLVAISTLQASSNLATAFKRGVSSLLPATNIFRLFPSGRLKDAATLADALLRLWFLECGLNSSIPRIPVLLGCDRDYFHFPYDTFLS